jgi:hypothetical protein
MASVKGIPCGGHFDLKVQAHVNISSLNSDKPERDPNLTLTVTC